MDSGAGDTPSPVRRSTREMRLTRTAVDAVESGESVGLGARLRASLSRVLLPTPSLPTTVLHGTSEHRPENKWRGCCGNDNSRGRRSTKTAPKKIDRYILFPDRSPSLFAYFVRDVMRSSNYSLRVGVGLSPRARRLNALAPAPLLPKQTASR